MNATEEREWWDEIAHGPDLDANIYDYTLGTVDECLAEILPALAPLPERPTILDLGCGVGRLAFAIGSTFPACVVVGVDISPAILAVARERRAVDNVSLIPGDGRELPAFLRVDAAYSMLMFQHIPADACAGYVREVARVLSTGGKFRFQDVIGTADQFLSHQTSESEMIGWCEDAGLEVIESETSRLHWEWRWMTARKP